MTTDIFNRLAKVTGISGPDTNAAPMNRWRAVLTMSPSTLGLAGAVMLATALTACEAYEPCQTASCAADRAISAEVLRQFSLHDAFMPNTIRVQTYDGVVYLYGFVDTEYELALATDIARVPGVKEVRNELTEWTSKF